MNDQTTDIQDMTDQERKQVAESAPAGGNMLMDRQAFAQAYQVARLFASSALVPQHLQGKPNDCFIALHMANRLGEDPLMVMQNIVIIHGTAGWKAQWLIGRANRSGVFKGRIRFETSGSGDTLRVDAKATLADTGEEVSAHADMAMAKTEGWSKNQKYQSMPQQMLSYRAASFLIRLYCPEATLGYQSAEEVEDMEAAGQIRDVTPGRHTPSDNGGAESALRNLPGENEPKPSEPAQPAAQPGEVKRDYQGTPFDSRIHAASGTTTKDGHWRRRRGVSDEYFEEVMAEILGRKGASEPTGADESDDSASGTETEGDTPPWDEAGTESAEAGAIDTETGEVASGGTEGIDQNAIVKRMQLSIPAARESGDLDTLEDLEDELRDLTSESWREFYRSQINDARKAINEGQK